MSIGMLFRLTEVIRIIASYPFSKVSKIIFNITIQSYQQYEYSHYYNFYLVKREFFSRVITVDLSGFFS